MKATRGQHPWPLTQISFTLHFHRHKKTLQGWRGGGCRHWAKVKESEETSLWLEKASATLGPLSSRADYPALERRKGKESTRKTKCAILLPFLSHEDRGGWQPPPPLSFYLSISPCLGIVYSFTKISLSIVSQYFSYNSPEFTASPALPWGFPFSLFSAMLPDQYSTTRAPTPSCFPHNSYQLTTCSCLSLLPLQSSSPGLVGDFRNSQNFRNSFLTVPSIFCQISSKLLLGSPPPPEAICMVEPSPFAFFRSDRAGPRKKVGWLTKY